jgi:hypothetical protein
MGQVLQPRGGSLLLAPTRSEQGEQTSHPIFQNSSEKNPTHRVSYTAHFTRLQVEVSNLKQLTVHAKSTFPWLQIAQPVSLEFTLRAQAFSGNNMVLTFPCVLFLLVYFARGMGNCCRKHKPLPRYPVVMTSFSEALFAELNASDASVARSHPLQKVQDSKSSTAFTFDSDSSHRC